MSWLLSTALPFLKHQWKLILAILVGLFLYYQAKRSGKMEQELRQNAQDEKFRKDTEEIRRRNSSKSDDAIRERLREYSKKSRD